MVGGVRSHVGVAAARLHGATDDGPCRRAFVAAPAASDEPAALPAQAKARETVYFKQTPFADGKAGKAGAWRVVRALGLRCRTRLAAHPPHALTLPLCGRSHH